MEERLQKMIRDLTGISRRDAEVLIKKGKVFVDGRVAKLGDKAARTSKITINNKIYYPEKKKKTHRYYLVYKPVGVASTNDDRHATRKVTDLVPNGKNLQIAGRLDVNSEGLIVLTSDGDLVFRLTHPSFEVPKVYDVEIEGHLSDKQVNKIKNGVTVKDVKYKVKSAKILHFSSHTQILRLTLTEGKKREIREILKSFGKKVLVLKRISIGKFFLGDLKPGQYSLLKPGDVATALTR